MLKLDRSGVKTFGVKETSKKTFGWTWVGDDNMSGLSESIKVQKVGFVFIYGVSKLVLLRNW